MLRRMCCCCTDKPIFPAGTGMRREEPGAGQSRWHAGNGRSFRRKPGASDQDSIAVIDFVLDNLRLEPVQRTDMFLHLHILP